MPLVLAACGGSDNGASSNGDPSSANYDPAATTLKDAGFEVCGDANTQIPQNLGSGPGVQNSRAFFIAVDCNGKETTPNVAMVFQFDSLQAVAIRRCDDRDCARRTAPRVRTGRSCS